MTTPRKRLVVPCEYTSPDSTLRFVLGSPELHATILFVATLITAYLVAPLGWLTIFCILIIGMVFCRHLAPGGRSPYIDDALRLIENAKQTNPQFQGPAQVRQVAVVTGGSSGIGLGTVKQLLQLGIYVIIAVRNPSKMSKVIQQELALAKAQKKVSIWDQYCYDKHYYILTCDLNNMNSLANEFYVHLKLFMRSKQFNTIHYLVNNAGAMVVKPHAITTKNSGILPVLAIPSNNNATTNNGKNNKQDYSFRPCEENTVRPATSNDVVITSVDHSFTTNHLGHFFLTLLLLPFLLNAQDARVVNTSSAIHVGVPKHQSLLLSLMNDPKTWDAPTAYQNTKILNTWFTQALQRRFHKFSSFDSTIIHDIIVEELATIPKAQIDALLAKLSNQNETDADVRASNAQIKGELERQLQAVAAIPTTPPRPRSGLESNLIGAPSAYVVHPGTVWTSFHYPFYGETPIYLLFFAAMLPLAAVVFKSIAQGCLTTVHCCVGRNYPYFKSLLEQVHEPTMSEKNIEGMLQGLDETYAPHRGPQPGQFHADCAVSPCSPAVNDIIRQEELWNLSMLLLREYINGENYSLYNYL